MGNQQPNHQWEQGAGGTSNPGGCDSTVLLYAKLQGHSGDPGGVGWH